MQHLSLKTTDLEKLLDTLEYFLSLSFWCSYVLSFAFPPWSLGITKGLGI